MRTALAVLLFASFAAGCGSDNAPEQLPQFSPPLGEPSPIVRGFFDLQDSSCETDGSQLRIAQNVQEVWMKGGFDYGQRSTWGGWEFGGSVDDENNVHFEIEGRNTTLTCTATLLEPVFQGTCEAPPLETCDFVFSRGAPREGVGEGNDRDGDGVVDGEDNCPSVANVDQADSDGDGRGDACESVGCPASSPDAAALVPPLDTDEDGIVDDCDEDQDGDGILNDQDQCPLVKNVPGTGEDLDRNNTPDECDDDDDDGIADGLDNCPYVSNSDQQDSDDNGVGNACVLDDDDEDGIPNNEDACPYTCLIQTLSEGTLCPQLRLPGRVDSDGNKIPDGERALIASCPIF